MQETRIRSLGWEDSLEEGMATLSNILAWRIPWIEESGGLQFQGIIVRHNSATKLPLPSPLYELAKWGKEEIHSLFNIQHTCYLVWHVKTDVQAPYWAAEGTVPGNRRVCPQGACSLMGPRQAQNDWDIRQGLNIPRNAMGLKGKRYSRGENLKGLWGGSSREKQGSDKAF